MTNFHAMLSNAIQQHWAANSTLGGIFSNGLARDGGDPDPLHFPSVRWVQQGGGPMDFVADGQTGPGAGINGATFFIQFMAFAATHDQIEPAVWEIAAWFNEPFRQLSFAGGSIQGVEAQTPVVTETDQAQVMGTVDLAVTIQRA